MWRSIIASNARLSGSKLRVHCRRLASCWYARMMPSTSLGVSCPSQQLAGEMTDLGVQAGLGGHPQGVGSGKFFVRMKSIKR